MTRTPATLLGCYQEGDASLDDTVGFLVTDSDDHLLGKVESRMYGTRPDRADAVSVRAGRFSQKRYLVPAETVETIDRATRLMRLRVDRKAILAFL
jgi:ribosomal 30S subunit maturation factor RimM